MRVKECLTSALFTTINNQFKQYAQSIDAEKYADAELFANPSRALILYNSHYGGLGAGDILEGFKDGSITTDAFADITEMLLFKNWLKYYDLNIAEYNPLYNVEGTETRVTVNDYGKKVTREQTADGKNNTTHAKTVTSEVLEPINSVDKLYGYNEATAVTVGENNTDNGKVKSTEGGTTNTAISEGTKEETASGEDTTTETTTRAGNIGTTKTTDMFLDQVSLLQRWNFLKYVFMDFNREFTTCCWECE